MLNTVAWAAIWYPNAIVHWLRVPTPTAQTLARLVGEIPSSDEPTVSQGVAGRFSGRIDENLIMGPGYYDTYPRRCGTRLLRMQGQR